MNKHFQILTLTILLSTLQSYAGKEEVKEDQAKKALSSRQKAQDLLKKAYKTPTIKCVPGIAQQRASLLAVTYPEIEKLMKKARAIEVKLIKLDLEQKAISNGMSREEIKAIFDNHDACIAKRIAIQAKITDLFTIINKHSK